MIRTGIVVLFLVSSTVVGDVVVGVATGVVAGSVATASDRQAPLTQNPGRIQKGMEVFNDRENGHCLLCHQLKSNPEPFQGNIGPSLDGIGSRLDPQQIRYRIIDNSRLNPQTLMPSYYRAEGFVQVAKAYLEQTVLSAQDIEDLVAYLVFNRRKMQEQQN